MDWLTQLTPAEISRLLCWTKGMGSLCRCQLCKSGSLNLSILCIAQLVYTAMYRRFGLRNSHEQRYLIPFWFEVKFLKVLESLKNTSVVLLVLRFQLSLALDDSWGLKEQICWRILVYFHIFVEWLIGRFGDGKTLRRLAFGLAV